jgi:hypothetical protein
VLASVHGCGHVCANRCVCACVRVHACMLARASQQERRNGQASERTRTHTHTRTRARAYARIIQLKLACHIDVATARCHFIAWQHDAGGTAGHETNYRNLLKHDTLRVCMQSFGQNYRSNPVTVCDSSVSLDISRCGFCCPGMRAAFMI